MQKHLLLFILFFNGMLVYAQKPPIKFGDIPVEQLKMTKYEKDSSAEAVVLADYGESVIEYDQGHERFVLKFERIRRIKILTKEGLRWADFSIELYHSSNGDDEKLVGLKAVTYNLENGKMVETKVKSDAIFKEKYDENFDIMKLTWPNVKEGSILEISYTINSDFVFNFQDWEFQETIPTIWSEYRAQIPEYFNYEKYMQGYVALAINEQKSYPGSFLLTFRETNDRTLQSKISTERIEFTRNNFRWVAKDVPAFKSEPFMTTYRDYISKINFELSFTQYPNQAVKNYMGSWDDINKLFAESTSFGEQVTSNNFLSKIAEEVTKGLTAPEEKIQAVYAFVKKNMLWDGVSRKYISSSLKKAWEDKKGNSTEINLLLASMLEKAGIKVYPVLISTRDHGFLRETSPVSTQFNYTVCEARIDDKSILLDATERLLPIGMLPERCLNGKGLAVSKEGYHWVNLKSPVKSRLTTNAVLSLNDQGELQGKLQIDRSGYYALTNRKSYLAKGESEYIKDLLGSRSWEFSKSEFKNVDEIQHPFVEFYDVVVNEHITTGGDMVYLNPFILFREVENPFKTEKREYPVDFGKPFDNIYIIKFTIPEGYTLEEVPKSKVFMLPESAAKYFYNVGQVGNIITITSSMSINRSLFSQLEYPNLREFYNQVVAKQNEQMVLKKK